MLKRIEDLNFYELLEVDPSATTQEVYRAYDRVKKVYDPNSVALYSLFTPDETAMLRQKIDEAYRTLSNDKNRKQYDTFLRERHELPEPEPLPLAAHRQQRQIPVPQVIVGEPLEEDAARPAEPLPRPAPPPPREQIRPAPIAVTEFTGATIRAIRENAGLSVRDVAGITKISERYLGYIEREAFEKLPARAYLRGFLLQYAKVLGAEPERMAEDYLKRYDRMRDE